MVPSACRATTTIPARRTGTSLRVSRARSIEKWTATSALSAKTTTQTLHILTSQSAWRNVPRKCRTGTDINALGATAIATPGLNGTAPTASPAKTTTQARRSGMDTSACRAKAITALRHSGPVPSALRAANTITIHHSGMALNAFPAMTIIQARHTGTITGVFLAMTITIRCRSGTTICVILAAPTTQARRILIIMGKGVLKVSRRETILDWLSMRFLRR